MLDMKNVKGSFEEVAKLLGRRDTPDEIRDELNWMIIKLYEEAKMIDSVRDGELDVIEEIY